MFYNLVMLSGFVMMVAAILLLLGKFQKITSAVLLLILIGITLTIQLEDLNDLGPFFKNVAIAGSLLFLLKNENYDYQKT